METKASSPDTLPQDIRKALQKHDALLRLSGSEIVSGISRLLGQGIPKEVISQVLTQAVEAVAKDFDPLISQDFYPRIETQRDAFTTEEASLREPPHPTKPAALTAFLAEESAPTAADSSVTNVPECEEISASGMSLNASISLHDMIPAFSRSMEKDNERERCQGSIAFPSHAAAKLISGMNSNLAAVSPITSFHLMTPSGRNGPLPAAKCNQMPISKRGSPTLETVNQLPAYPQWPRTPFAALRRIRQMTSFVRILLRRLVFEFKRDWIAMVNAIALSETKKSLLRWLRQPNPSNFCQKTRVGSFKAHRDLHQ